MFDFVSTVLGLDISFPMPFHITFSAGSTNGSSQCVQVTVRDDECLEGEEIVRIGVQSGSSHVAVGSLSETIVTIQDREGQSLSE